MLIIILFLTGVSFAQDIRPASEEEMLDALLGCWLREHDFRDNELERVGYITRQVVCFHPEARITMSSVGGHSKGGI